MLSKDFNGQWVFWNVQDVDQGKSFLDCEKLIKRNLVKIGFDENLFLESKNWTGS
jgi:hypothetical protein